MIATGWFGPIGLAVAVANEGGYHLVHFLTDGAFGVCASGGIIPGRRLVVFRLRVILIFQLIDSRFSTLAIVIYAFVLIQH